MIVIEIIVSGLILGGLYATVALGLTLQYGVARIMNLAYGEFIVAAAFAAWWLFTASAVSPLAGLILLLRPLVGGAEAERIAVAVAPLLPYLLLLFGVALTARRLVHPLAVPEHAGVDEMHGVVGLGQAGMRQRKRRVHADGLLERLARRLVGHRIERIHTALVPAQRIR